MRMVRSNNNEKIVNMQLQAKLHQMTQKYGIYTRSATHISMLVGMSWKLAAILGSMGFQQELTEGPLCCIFILGFKVVMAACSKRLS